MNWTRLLPWLRRRDARLADAALAAAEAAQAAERAAALDRILGDARRNEGPYREAPTRALPQVGRPLMTPGQEYRGRGNRRP